MSDDHQGRFGVVFADQIDVDVSDAAFRLFVRLTTYADREGRCWPGVALLARLSGVQQRQVYKLLQELVDAGLITREPRFRQDGSQCSSVTVIPVRARQAGLSQPDRGAWATRTGLEQTTRTPKRTPKSPAPPGPAKNQEDPVPVYGALGDAEMPEHGAAPKKAKPPFEQAPKEGTHAWAVYRFEQERIKAQVGTHRYNRGHLNRLLKSLRDDGMTNAEIVVLVRTFFLRHAPVIRTKVREIDLVVVFAQMVPQIQQQAKDEIENVRTGRTSATDRSIAESNTLKARLKEIE